MHLWQMSFYGGMMAMAVAVVRRLLQNRLPREVFLVLWAVVVLRLLVPVNVRTGCNIYAWLGGSFSESSKEVRQFFGGGGRKAMETTGERSGELREITVEAQSGTQPKADYLASVGKVIYLAGVFLCAGYYLSAYARCCREFRFSLPVEDSFVLGWADSLSLKRRLSIRRSEAIAAPVTYGIFRPVILLPKQRVWEDEKQLEFALAHEAEHIRHFDTCKKLALLAAVCVHWCNPMAWRMLSLANQDLELACDGRVVRRYGDGSRSAYAFALICMEEKKNNWAAVGNGFGESGMEERVVAIMNRKKRTMGALLAAAVTVAGVMAVFATAPAAEGKNASHPAGETGNIMYHISASEDFPEYEKFGLHYEKEQGRLMYGGEAVGYFKDEIQPGSYRRFYTEDGTVGIVVARDSSNKIIGFHAGEVEEIMNAYSGSGVVAAEVSTEEGSDSPVTVAILEEEGIVREEMGLGSKAGIPEEYKAFGVKESADFYKWQWDGRPIAVLYDEGHYIYTGGEDSKDAAYLNVCRDSKGEIVALEELAQEKMWGIVGKRGW